MSQSLWKHGYTQKAITSPKILIEDQAKLLSKLTENLVLARVSEFEFTTNSMQASLNTIGKSMALLAGSKREQLGELTSSKFSYEFFITGKNYPNYKYRAFVFEYGLKLYPVTFFIDEEIAEEVFPTMFAEEEQDQGIDQGKDRAINIAFEVPTESEMIDLLGKILTSNTLSNIINSLLSM